MIPHKSSKYRAILYLLFVLKVARWDLPSVDEATKEKAPDEALEKVGKVTTHIIEALSTAPLSEDPIHFSKLDIRYGFWTMVCAVV